VTPSTIATGLGSYQLKNEAAIHIIIVVIGNYQYWNPAIFE
jgi:hypothetical protein